MSHIALFRSLSPLAFALLAAAPGCVAADGETQTDPFAEGALESDDAETEAAAAEISWWEDSTSTSTLVNLSTSFYVPPHVGGDTEYKGHGPSVSLQVELVVFNDRELWAAVTMDALETKSDWTRAAGTAWYHLHTASDTIVEVDGPIDFTHTYTDTDHAHDIFSFAPGNLVSMLDYVGDTDGKEAGTKTGVRVYFNPITIVTE